MTGEQLEKLISLLDPRIWKNPAQTISEMIEYYYQNFRLRIPLGLDREAPCPPDYREVAQSILRSGRPLSKEEKKKYDIHPSAKVSNSIFKHFNEPFLKDCVKQAQILAHTIIAIEEATSTLKRWASMGIKKVEFSPPPDPCEKCASLKGVYHIDNVPIPILDTHLECRCWFLAAEE